MERLLTAALLLFGVASQNQVVLVLILRTLSLLLGLGTENRV